MILRKFGLTLKPNSSLVIIGKVAQKITAIMKDRNRRLLDDNIRVAEELLLDIKNKIDQSHRCGYIRKDIQESMQNPIQIKACLRSLLYEASIDENNIIKDIRHLLNRGYNLFINPKEAYFDIIGLSLIMDCGASWEKVIYKYICLRIFLRHIQIGATCRRAKKGYRDYWHPHVGSMNGFICLGAGYSPYYHAFNQGRLVDMVDIIIAVLSTYNPGGAFVPIQAILDTQYKSCRECGMADRNMHICPVCKFHYCSFDVFSCDNCRRMVCRSCIDAKQVCNLCNKLLVPA